MGDKQLEKTLDNLRKDEFRVIANANDWLFDGKTPKYHVRFKSWAKNTNGEHLDNLVNALLSAVAYSMATGQVSAITQKDSVEHLRGMTQGILALQEYVRLYASETVTQSQQKKEEAETEEGEDDVISGLDE